MNLPASLETIFLDAIHDVKLHLNSPQLRNVFCGFDYKNITFSHPESVKHMVIIDLNPDTYDDLQIFPNVEYFRCGAIKGANLGLLRLFPKVKKICFVLGAIEKDELKNLINDLIHQKNVSGRADLEIVCNAVMTVRYSINPFGGYINSVNINELSKMIAPH